MLCSGVMTPPEQQPSAPNRLAKPPRWRRAVQSVGWVLAGLVVVMLIWVTVQVLLRRPHPALLFTEADLPKLPKAGENGWEVLRTEMHAIRDPQRPDKEMTEICDAKATFEDRWARAEARASKLSDVAQDEQTKKWLAVADKASANPRFADACPISFEPDCPTPLQLLALHQLQEAVVLHDALGSRWDDALARTKRMMRVDVDFLPSGRSTLSQAIARAHVHRSIKLVDVLLVGAVREKERGPDGARLVAFAREIDATIAKIREDDMAPLRAVIAEYLFSAYAIDYLTTSTHGRYRQASDFLYDPGHTLEMLNEQFEQYAAFARAGGTGKPPEFQRKWNWFLRNPVGHLALGATHGTLENHIPTISRDRASLLKDREDLHNRLTALTNPH